MEQNVRYFTKKKRKQIFQSEFFPKNTTESTRLQVSHNICLVMEKRRRTLLALFQIQTHSIVL